MNGIVNNSSIYLNFFHFNSNSSVIANKFIDPRSQRGTRNDWRSTSEFITHFSSSTFNAIKSHVNIHTIRTTLSDCVNIIIENIPLNFTPSASKNLMTERRTSKGCKLSVYFMVKWRYWHNAYLITFVNTFEFNVCYIECIIHILSRKYRELLFKTDRAEGT